MRQIRTEAYGEDLGQHSWVNAEELRGDIGRLGLTEASRLLDLGCGLGGALVWLVSETGCRGVGLELSPSAVELGRARAARAGVADRFEAVVADLDRPLPADLGAFDAAMSIDVLVHLHNRAGLFREVAARLRPGGRFLLSDAGVVTGPISTDEVRRRSLHGSTMFVPPGYSEGLLEQAGLRVIEVEDRTASVIRNAGGRLAAFHAHRTELAEIWGVDRLEDQVGYLETTLDLSRRRALSRITYFAERP